MNSRTLDIGKACRLILLFVAKNISGVLMGERVVLGGMILGGEVY